MTHSFNGNGKIIFSVCGPSDSKEQMSPCKILDNFNNFGKNFQSKHYWISHQRNLNQECRASAV